MPLFVCPECQTVENTALATIECDVWGQIKRRLCSACGGRWHGRFPRETYDEAKHGPLSDGGFIQREEKGSSRTDN